MAVRFGWTTMECPSFVAVGVEFHKQRDRCVYACPACLHKIAPTANTILHDTRTPIASWFFAMHLFTNHTPRCQRQGWIARTGSPRRDLPSMFGKWNTAFRRYRDWVRADVAQMLSEAVSGDHDMEFAMIDGTIVKVHRHGQGAKGGLKVRPSAAPKAA